MFLATKSLPKPLLNITLPGPTSRIGGLLGQENRGGEQLEVQASVHGARRSLFPFFFFFFPTSFTQKGQKCKGCPLC